MTKRIATAVAVFGAASIISGCDIQQPAAGCIVQDASVYAWQAAYFPKTEADAAKSCGQLKGERLGVWKFSNPDASAEQKAANNGSFLAIRPARLAGLTRSSYTYETGALDKDGKPVKKTVTVDRVTPDQWANATSQSQTFPELPDDDGFCKATGFAQASITVEAVANEKDATKVELPAASRTYQYGDIEVYSHPAAPGTQLRGTLTYSEPGCTAEYNVLALWPSVGCDPAVADSCASDPHINPDFKTVCIAGIGPSGSKGGCVPDPAVGLTLVGKK
jgi:hypothetical protein